MSFSAGELRLSAPAKVNLVLRVLDRRPDGYHNLWSLMQTVELADELALKVRPDTAEVVLRCTGTSLPTDGRNLVVRAAQLVLGRAGRRVGLDIDITKRIPISAGLGGGSSDAAATILALNHLLGLGWSTRRLADLAQQLGSDVPFFLHGPTALIEGRGEQVTPARLTGSRWIVLVNPGFPISTRWAYAHLAERREAVRPVRQELTRLQERGQASWDEVVPLMENDFESVLLPLHDELARIKHGLLAAGAEQALVSGSGATVFGIFPNEEAAGRARDRLAVQERWRVYAVRAGGMETPRLPVGALS
ncbi:MAG: 4-(cytidine 5'-diphospho)-2-C-methyl-D-erythritol kinase [Nitrospirales bacterium]